MSGDAGRSSSLDLSSPPSGNSPQRQTISNHVGQNLDDHTMGTLQFSEAKKVGGDEGTKGAAKDPSAPKRSRAKKEPDNKTPHQDKSSPAQNTNGEQAKPTKQRIKRGTGPRAMKKKAEAEARRAAEEAAAMQQQRTDFGNSFPHPTPPPENPALPQNPAQPNLAEREVIHNKPSFSPQPNLTPQRPISGQNYDPIRSSTVAPRPASPNTPNLTAAMNHTRSPSISSLIDPPNTTRSYNAYPHLSKRDGDHTPSAPYDAKRPRLSPSTSTSAAFIQHSGVTTSMETASAASRDKQQAAPIVAAKQSVTALPKKPTPTASKGPSPGSHSPKPPPRKEAALLPTTGSGLLSGSVFGAVGGVDSAGSGPEKNAPTVVINVPLTGDNQYVNFTRLAEEKYGFNALHPRLAMQRERLARVAAAGAALENAHKGGGSGRSADEMSVDLSNDEGDNSNVEMGGVDERGLVLSTRSGEDTGEAPKPKKRTMKEDMYDKDDDFIDDTEQAWEEQAAVSKDGFFVYSGPLVPEGEEAKVERYVSLAISCPSLFDSKLTLYRADGAPKRGGRGGGRGGRGSGAGRGKATTAGAGKESKDGKPVQKRVRRSREQIERDEREAALKKSQKENLALLASKPPAPFIPSQQQGIHMPT